MAEFETELSNRLAAASDAAAPDIAGRVAAVLQQQEAARRRSAIGLAALLTFAPAVAIAIVVFGADRALNILATDAGWDWVLKIPVAFIAVAIAFGASAAAGILMHQIKR
ncbi:MAG: hypothetical protein ACKVOB_12245 [Sphingomonas sp.]